MYTASSPYLGAEEVSSPRLVVNVEIPATSLICSHLILYTNNSTEYTPQINNQSFTYSWSFNGEFGANNQECRGLITTVREISFVEEG